MTKSSVIYNELSKSNKKKTFAIALVIITLISTAIFFVINSKSDNNYTDSDTIIIRGVLNNIYTFDEDFNGRYIFNISNSMYVFDFSLFEYDPIRYFINGLSYEFTVTRYTHTVLEVKKI